MKCETQINYKLGRTQLYFSWASRFEMNIIMIVAGA